MKIKTAWLKEMHGALGKPFLGGKTCFKTDRHGNIIGVKSPSEPRVPSGKQNLYRHQLRFWSLYWNFLTPAQKKVYNDLGDESQITGYDYFMKKFYDKAHLYLAATHNRWVEKWRPGYHPTVEETLHMSDDEENEDWIYIDFPLSVIPKNLTITKCELWLRYTGEAGWGGTGRQIDCHKIVDQWHENTITYNNRPSISGTETDHADMPGMGGWLIFDVISDINALINSQNIFFGWRIKYHTTVATQEAMSGLRSAYPHDDDSWPYLKLFL